MPAFSAFSTGTLKAVLLISETAIPSAPDVTAVLIALTIWSMFSLSEPVHSYEQPSSLHASAMPYCVGTKNEFVVTWLTTTNLYDGCEPKMPEEPPPPLLALDEFDDPQALSKVPTEPAAMPVRAVRRRKARRSKPSRPTSGRSRWSRGSTTSWIWSVSGISVLLSLCLKTARCFATTVTTLALCGP